MRKRRKLLEVGEYNQAYDEVMVVDDFCVSFVFLCFLPNFCPTIDLRCWLLMREGMSQRRR